MPSHGAWGPGDPDSMLDWTAGQHLDVAVKLLGGLETPTLSEDGEGSTPPWLHYSATDPDARRGEETDYGPWLAALAHVGIALVKQGWESRG